MSKIPKPRLMHVTGVLKACCSRESNLGALERFNDEIQFRRCLVCQCRHFEANAEPGRIFTQGYAIGQ